MVILWNSCKKTVYLCLYGSFLPNISIWWKKQHLTLSILTKSLRRVKEKKKHLPTLCLLLLSAKIFHCRPLFCCFSIIIVLLGRSSRVTPITYRSKWSTFLSIFLMQLIACILSQIILSILECVSIFLKVHS